MTDYYTDAEVDELTAGLVQDAAKIRFLRSLGLRVDRKPNGKPLAWRAAPASPAGQNEVKPEQPVDVVVGLQAWARERKQRGQKAQGR